MSAYSDFALALIAAAGGGAYWDLNAANGGNDLSGNGHNLSAQGGVSLGGFADSPIFGEATCTDFDNADDFLRATGYNPFANGTTRSFFGWANRDTNSATDNIFGSANDRTNFSVIGTAGGTVTFDPDQLTGGTCTWNAWPGNALWVFWAVVFNEPGDSAELFINGVSAGAVAVTNAWHGTPGDLVIGARNLTPIQPWDGKMAGLGVVEGLLTSGQISQLYSLGINGPPPPPTPARPKAPIETWQALELNLRNGRKLRFGPDERDYGDLPKNLGYDTGIPGGFGDGSVVLSRPRSFTDRELGLLADVRAYGPGNRTFYEGRVKGVPRLGATEVQLNFEGHIAELGDDQAFREIYVDPNLANWREPSAQRKLNLLGIGVNPLGPNVVADDTSGAPSLELAAEDTWGGTGQPGIEAWYSGEGIPLGVLYYAWKRSSTLDNSNVNWNWSAAGFSGDDASGLTISTANLRAAGPGSGTLSLPVGTNYLVLQLSYAGSNGVAGQRESLFWTLAAVLGRHFLPVVLGPSGQPTLLGSDVVADAVSRTAPGLTFTTGSGGSIEPSTFGIAELVFKDLPNTGRDVVERCTALGGAQDLPNDWGAYEEKEFFWRSPGSYGKTWRVRHDQFAETSDEGPDAEERCSGMFITYQDNAGVKHSVGPPGSGADFETNSLQNVDPDNPVEGVIGYHDIGISYRDAAIAVGQVALLDANSQDHRGDVELEGTVFDDAGNEYAAAMVRGGDRILIEDEEEPQLLPINSGSYDHNSEKVNAKVGATPHSLDVLLAKLVAVTPA